MEEEERKRDQGERNKEECGKRMERGKDKKSRKMRGNEMRRNEKKMRRTWAVGR